MARVARSARTRASHVGNTVPTAASRARLSEERAVRARPKDGRETRVFPRDLRNFPAASRTRAHCRHAPHDLPSKSAWGSPRA
jgi:hypothetical protein